MLAGEARKRCEGLDKRQEELEVLAEAIKEKALRDQRELAKVELRVHADLQKTNEKSKDITEQALPELKQELLKAIEAQASSQRRDLDTSIEAIQAAQNGRLQELHSLLDEEVLAIRQAVTKTEETMEININELRELMSNFANKYV